MKSQGRAVWARFNDTLREGRIPAREIVDGVLVIFGGAFLITPGFITDILGFLLLIPITRRLFRGTLQRRLALRAIPIGRRPSRYDYDVEGTASEHYEPPPPSPGGAPAGRAPAPLRLGRGGHGGRALRAAAPLRRAPPSSPIAAPAHVTGTPLALSFFDPDRQLSGTARAGMTLLFEGTTPT